MRCNEEGRTEDDDDDLPRRRCIRHAGEQQRSDSHAEEAQWSGLAMRPEAATQRNRTDEERRHQECPFKPARHGTRHAQNRERRQHE